MHHEQISDRLRKAILDYRDAVAAFKHGPHTPAGIYSDDEDDPMTDEEFELAEAQDALRQKEHLRIVKKLHETEGFLLGIIDEVQHV